MYFLSLLIFGFFYLIVYCLPIAVVTIILSLSTAIKLPAVISTPLILVYLLVYLLLILLASFRAKLAADLYDGVSIGFVAAHTQSGLLLKSHLYLIPLIGKYFNKRSEPRK